MLGSSVVESSSCSSVTCQSSPQRGLKQLGYELVEDKEAEWRRRKEEEEECTKRGAGVGDDRAKLM